MIRVFVSYKVRDAVLFYINHHITVEEARDRFLGPFPLIFQTTEGPVSIEWEQVRKVYIQQVEHNKMIGEVVEVSGEAMENNQYTLPSVPVVTLVEEELKMGDEDVQTYPVEEKKVVDAKILNEKFKSFRQQFLDLENSQESWENQIIEKMAAREGLLKTFAETIEEENTALDAFKSDKVGS